jgi:hypothetical protein
MNPIRSLSDQPVGERLEGIMLIQTLATGFVLAFIAIAVFGHVLLLQAALTPPRA